MNRDESRLRVPGLPPEIRSERGRNVLAPSEPGGGTWIGVNDGGNSLALINWYSKPKIATTTPVSRGEIVRQLLPFATNDELREAFSLISLAGVQPFRMISMANTERQLQEWRWDGLALEEVAWPWERQHWFSSGYDEAKAQRVRGVTCERFQTVETFQDLCRLHSSHSPDPGPFSVCMHRHDAATVSFTGITVSGGLVEMQYVAGAPCESTAPHLVRRMAVLT